MPSLSKIEQAYWQAKAQADKADQLLKQAKQALLDSIEIKPGPLSETQAQEFEASKKELDSTKVSLFAKSRQSWDSETLLALADQCPGILKAQQISFWSEARISKK